MTTNLTLTGTANPDFGQVEVDPAVVNLSQFETFFPEKRSFFVEGASNFRFGQGASNHNFGFNWREWATSAWAEISPPSERPPPPMSSC